MTLTMTRSGQRGSALLVTMILTGALLAGASVVVLMQMNSNRATDLTRNGLAAIYCAEAGLSAARPVVMANYGQWNPALQYESVFPGVEPPFLLSGIASHSIGSAGDTATDFVITLKDNDDEVPDNGSADFDLKIFIVSTCVKFPDNPKQVEELVQYTGGGQCYQSQLGGCGGNGNNN